MNLKFISIFFSTVVLATLMTGTGSAGWGDTLKSVGSDYADQGATTAGLPYTPSEAVAGVKEILSLGTDSAVSQLGTSGGFSSNPATAIPLPDMFKGMGDTSGLLGAFNKAAEASIPSTGNVFMDAIQSLTIDNAAMLLGGGDDAITRFFEQSSRSTIKKLVKPIVGKSLEASGANTYLNALMGAQQMSGVSGPPFDAADFVTDKTLDSMFYLIGAQEKSIRANGGAGTTELLKKIF